MRFCITALLLLTFALPVVVEARSSRPDHRAKKYKAKAKKYKAPKVKAKYGRR
jgi:hypothetical protein